LGPYHPTCNIPREGPEVSNPLEVDISNNYVYYYYTPRSVTNILNSEHLATE